MSLGRAIHLRCGHRGVALDYGHYGRVEDDRIRCPYHGWLYDRSGQCIEQPADAAQRGIQRSPQMRRTERTRTVEIGRHQSSLLAYAVSIRGEGDPP